MVGRTKIVPSTCLTMVRLLMEVARSCPSIVLFATCQLSIITLKGIGGMGCRRRSESKGLRQEEHTEATCPQTKLTPHLPLSLSLSLSHSLKYRGCLRSPTKTTPNDPLSPLKHPDSEPMDYKLNRESALILFFFIFLLSAAGNEAEKSNMEVGEKKLSASETVRSMFSLPSVSTSTYWMKVKTMMNQAQTYFFPPNLDFRSRHEAEAIEGGGGGTGKKVKEAAVKTCGKSKSTVEDSAKLAGETLQKTAHKVKESLSSDFGGEEAADPRTEL